MVHSGFQQLYREKADQYPSPKDKIYEVIEAFKNDDDVSIEKVTVVGHSLGAGKSSFSVIHDRTCLHANICRHHTPA